MPVNIRSEPELLTWLPTLSSLSLDANLFLSLVRGTRTRSVCWLTFWCERIFILLRVLLSVAVMSEF